MLDNWPETLVPLDRAEGDGVIVCGGGRYWSGVVTCVRMLRRVSDLPVQIWHRADERVRPSDLKECPEVSYHNASSYPHQQLASVEVKSLAALHCGLERFMLLDADTYPVVDPKPLLSLADPVAFWSNHEACAAAEQCDWSGYGLESIGEVPAVHGGHYFVHRRKAWEFLNLNRWVNDRSDVYYPLGASRDEHAFRACLAYLKTPYRDLGSVVWTPPAVIGCYAGHPAVVHFSGRSKMMVERIGHLPKGREFMDTLVEFLTKR